MDENIENFTCAACGSNVPNKHYVGHGAKLDKAAEDIKKLEARLIAQVPKETLKLLEAERKKQRAKYILMRVLITIAGGLILQFIIRFIWF